MAVGSAAPRASGRAESTETKAIRQKFMINFKHIRVKAQSKLGPKIKLLSSELLTLC
jgi:hypothetical protein